MKPLLGILFAAYCVSAFGLSLFLSRFHPLAHYALATPRIENKTTASPPVFSSIDSLHKKKDAFFGYFLPLIQHENNRITEQRQVLIKIAHDRQANRELNDQQQRIIRYYSAIYDVNLQDSDEAQLQELLVRVNIIPASLALAQAAIESGWGRSRFALKGNNYFGQRCHSQNCGLTPKKRSHRQRHQVKAFDSPLESIRSYMHNLNTHKAYRTLRQLRLKQAINMEKITGLALTAGLVDYSERKEQYVKDVRRIIMHEQLAQYD